MGFLLRGVKSEHTFLTHVRETFESFPNVVLDVISLVKNRNSNQTCKSVAMDKNHSPHQQPKSYLGGC